MAAARARSRADEGRVKPRSDAYVGLLGLSLLALSAAMLFAFLNWQGIAEKPPKEVKMAAPAGGGGAAPRIAPGGPANAPAPGAGGAQPAPGGPGPAPGGGNQPQPKK